MSSERSAFLHTFAGRCIFSAHFKTSAALLQNTAMAGLLPQHWTILSFFCWRRCRTDKCWLCSKRIFCRWLESGTPFQSRTKPDYGATSFSLYLDINHTPINCWRELNCSSMNCINFSEINQFYNLLLTGPHKIPFFPVKALGLIYGSWHILHIVKEDVLSEEELNINISKVRLTHFLWVVLVFWSSLLLSDLEQQRFRTVLRSKSAA